MNIYSAIRHITNASLIKITLTIYFFTNEKIEL